MLLGDPAKPEDDSNRVLLFRDPRTGKEMSRTCFDEWFSKTFVAVGLIQFKGFPHSLRIGGATTLLALHGDGSAQR